MCVFCSDEFRFDISISHESILLYSESHFVATLYVAICLKEYQSISTLSKRGVYQVIDANLNAKFE